MTHTTEQVKELLKPRYKVIGDFPHSSMPVGMIIKVETKDLAFWDKYPHLFRKLHWWEEREVSEMPECVSFISKSLKEKYGDEDEAKIRKFIKIIRWAKDDEGNWFYSGSKFNRIGHTYMPATLEEYNQYIQTKK